MNFPEKAIVSGPRSFVTEKELDDRRKKRQEEWEKTRKPEDPEEAPEEEYDHRTLYERLQENKMKKEAEFEEAHKLKNMVRGLDSDEVAFLEHVDRTKMEEEDRMMNEEEKAIADFKEAAARLSQEEQEKNRPSAKSIWKSKGERQQQQSSTTTSSLASKQATLLKQSVKRKEPESSRAGEEEDTATKKQSVGERMQCIGVLPGIGGYDHSDSSDSENSDSDSDLEVRGGGFDLLPRVCGGKSSGQCQ